MILRKAAETDACVSISVVKALLRLPIVPDKETNNDVDPLTRLAIKYGTDKWGTHFYTPLYHKLFAHQRDRPVRLLEIGVGGYKLLTVGGASLAMWADYFHSGQITGIDIAEKRLALNPRVKLFCGSQEDPIFLKRVCDERGPFDIIIDDGSHVPKHVVASFNLLFPSVVDGGMYIVEDVQTAFWPGFGGSSLDGGETLQLVRMIIECLNHAEIGVVDQAHSFPSYAKQIRALRAFHNLLVVDKGDNSEPSNAAFDVNNRHAANALRIIEREMEVAPTAEGLANLVDFYMRGGDHAKAKELADKALSLWPCSAVVLMAAYFAASLRNDKAAKVNYLERILRIEPENAVVERTLAQARDELKQ